MAAHAFAAPQVPAAPVQAQIPARTPVPAPIPAVAPAQAAPVSMASGGGPVAFFPEMQYNFGAALEDSEVTRDFTVKNIGDQPLQIIRVQSG